MRVTDKNGKTTPFDLHDTGGMHFVPKKQSGAKREIALKLGMDEGPGPTIEATYTVDGKQMQFTLRRIE